MAALPFEVGQLLYICTTLERYLHVDEVNSTSMKRLMKYVLPIILCFAVGWAAMLFQRDALVEWYPLLDKPSITPPNAVFPIAWSIIYICI